jgi:SAM-dependent methyltransferase
MAVDGFDPQVISAAYAAVAEEYAVRFGNDLVDLELDRVLLDDIAARCIGRGVVLDLGCGPAHLSEHLISRAVDCVGVDLTPAMLTVAQRRVPNLPLAAGDIRSLGIRTGSTVGIVAFYLLQHLERSELPAVTRELRRVLALGGVLLIAAHAGGGEFRPTPEIRATRYTPAELEQHCVRASFAVEAVHHRSPLQHEYQGDRVYVVARAI